MKLYWWFGRPGWRRGAERRPVICRRAGISAHAWLQHAEEAYEASAAEVTTGQRRILSSQACVKAAVKSIMIINYNIENEINLSYLKIKLCCGVISSIIIRRLINRNRNITYKWSSCISYIASLGSISDGRAMTGVEISMGQPFALVTTWHDSGRSSGSGESLH